MLERDFQHKSFRESLDAYFTKNWVLTTLFAIAKCYTWFAGEIPIPSCCWPKGIEYLLELSSEGVR
jgi:hypothetical protein